MRDGREERQGKHTKPGRATEAMTLLGEAALDR